MSSSLNTDSYNTRETNNSKINNERGTIPGLLGTGEDAKNSIVYSVIKWTFLVGFFITIIFTIYNFCFIDKKIEGTFIEQIKSIWGIFIPLITLTLGYVFGANKND